jgi:hypothetical protein
MKLYHFAIATDWEYDLEFINLLEEYALEKKFSTYVVKNYNLKETIELIKKGEINFSFLLDRASDTSPEFLTLHNLLLEKQIKIFDSHQKLRWAANKAIMHDEFLLSNISVPNTIVLSPYQETGNIELNENELKKIGIPFIIKPADTVGGGIGVVKNAQSNSEINDARKEFPKEKYLIQEKIVPKEEENKRFWFRGFYFCGKTEAAWWNDLEHIYELLSQEHIIDYNLYPLFRIIRQIAKTSGLNFFSTEIAMNEREEFKVIDYVNEICDMRPKSQHKDGVPDEIVKKIARHIVEYVNSCLKE